MNEEQRNTTIDLDLLEKGNANMAAAMAQMGYTSLRKGQINPINCIMMGRDTFVILPTGGGKSAIMALPTVALGWKTIVFSPLKALMADQVQSMNRMGIRAGSINSNNTDAENAMTINEWTQGELQLLYVAPERLDNEQFKAAVAAVPPDMVVLDEAHTLSQWSATFRPSYTQCGKFVEVVNPRVVVAMTATATKEIIDDVKRVLKVGNICLCSHYEPRTNLKLSSSICEDEGLLDNILRKVREVKGKVIVYCSTVTEVTSVVSYLDNFGESVTFYHGQMNGSHAESNMNEFSAGRKRIMVATNAFGMGIDIPDIEGVIHASIPGSVEAISQEVGRAARDGRDAMCHMFFTKHGEAIQRFFFKMMNPPSSALISVYKYLEGQADSSGDVYKTIKDIVEALGGATELEGVCNYLVTLGCIERRAPENHVHTVIINNPDAAIVHEDRNKIFQAIKAHGIRKCSSEIGNEVVEIALETLELVTGIGAKTIKRHFKGLKDTDDACEVLPAFRGKITHLIHPPTKKDRETADGRRALESKKLIDVIKYINTPDEEKHNFLTNYFKVVE